MNQNGGIVPLLIAGGRSRRMGRDKALLEVEGTPFWQRQTEVLREAVGAEPWLSARERPEWWPTTAAFIADEDDAGPFGGLVAILRALPMKGAALILAVDMPCVTVDFLRQLMARRRAVYGVVPVTPDGYEPLAALYPQAALSLAEKHLRESRFALCGFTKALVEAGLVDAWNVSPVDAARLANVNRPVDWPLPGGMDHFRPPVS